MPRGRGRCTTSWVGRRKIPPACCTYDFGALASTDALGRASAGRAPVGPIARMSALGIDGTRALTPPRDPDDERRAAATVCPAHSYTPVAMLSTRSPAPIAPGATIGILGGGQLGRMLGFAARAIGYRIAILDPDPDCPAASIADRVVVAPYDSLDGAVELARDCAVVTYELEHVDAALVDLVEIAGVPVRPGAHALRMTQDRLAERRFVASLGIATAPWREVADEAGLRRAAAELGTPLRLKAPTGGYDGRSQVRIATPNEIPGALGQLGRPPGARLLVERELDFDAELSVITARSLATALVAFPIARNRHDAGILVESVAPAPVAEAVAQAARVIGARIAEALDAVGLVTAELFLLRDGTLAVNELAPRVHNSRPLDDRGCPDQPVRAARAGDLRPAAGRLDRARADRHGQPAGHGRVARGPPGGRRGRAGGPAPPPPRVRQAAGLRAPEDGPPDRGRGGRRRGRPRPRARRTREAALGLNRA